MPCSRLPLASNITLQLLNTYASRHSECSPFQLPSYMHSAPPSKLNSICHTRSIIFLAMCGQLLLHAVPQQHQCKEVRFQLLLAGLQDCMRKGRCPFVMRLRNLLDTAGFRLLHRCYQQKNYCVPVSDGTCDTSTHHFATPSHPSCNPSICCTCPVAIFFNLTENPSWNTDKNCSIPISHLSWRLALLCTMCASFTAT